MAKRPSFMTKMLDDNRKVAETIKKSLDGEQYGYMGDPALNWATGGYQRGHLNLLYGPSKSGKSTFALKYCGQEQAKKGGAVIIIDSEGSLSDQFATDVNGELTASAKKTRRRLESAGIDPENCIIRSSNNINYAFKYLPEWKDALESDPTSISAILVDSWEGFHSQLAYEKINKKKVDEAGNSFGGNAKTINPTLKYLLDIATSYGVTVFSIQHVRVNMEQYGPKWLIPGGQTFIHLHAMICLIEGSETKKNSLLVGDVEGNSASDMAMKVGKLVRFKCDKSRANVEGRQGETFINFETIQFVKKEESLFNLASRLGIIVHPEGKGNSWWQYPAVAESPIQWYGSNKAIANLTEDEDLYKEIYRACMESSKTRGTEHELGTSGVVDESGEVVSTKETKSK